MPASFQKDGKERVAYQGKLIEIVEQPMKLVGASEKRKVTFERARRAPGVRLIIIDNKKQHVLLTREFRHELNAYDYRLPGGKVADSLAAYHNIVASNDVDRVALAKAHAEAEEEAGITPKSIKKIHTSVVGATIEWDLFYYLVRDFTATHQQLEPGEDICVGWYPFEDARTMCLSGQLSEERSALVLLKTLHDSAYTSTSS